MFSKEGESMNITVKRLTADLIEDYIYFHKHVAFSDNPEWAGCFCVWYHWTDDLDVRRQTYEENGGTDFKESLAREFIEQGKLKGYLAYSGNEVIAWCNVNNRNNFAKLDRVNSPEIWQDYNNEKIKSLLCITVAPSMRRKGVSKGILKEIIKDSVEEGYDYLEVYPGQGEMNEKSYRGASSVYEHNGFVRLEHDLETMRLDLSILK